jgi:hypothetical protein
MVETLDKVIERSGDRSVSEAAAGVRAELVRAHQMAVESILDEEKAMVEVVVLLREGRGRVDAWSIDRDGFAALRGGLKRVYKRGRKELAVARAERTAETLHDWRKQVKYLWYHVRILRSLWPDLLGEMAGALHDLSDYLGEDHNLAGLKGFLLGPQATSGDDGEVRLLVDHVDRRRSELQSLSWPLGSLLYAEKPSAFVARMAEYWQIWEESFGSG